MDFFYGLGYGLYETTLQITSYGRTEEGRLLYLASGIDFIGRKGGVIKLEFGPSYLYGKESNGINNSIKRKNRLTGYLGLKFDYHFGGESNSSKSKVRYRQVIIINIE